MRSSVTGLLVGCGCPILAQQGWGTEVLPWKWGIARSGRDFRPPPFAYGEGWGTHGSLRRTVPALVLALVLAGSAAAQTASIGRQRATKAAPVVKRGDVDPRNLVPKTGNPTLERHSLTAVTVKPPRKFKVHDLITIIIREQRKFESDGELESKKQYDLKAGLEDIFKPIDGTLGAGTFTNGKPRIDLKLNNRLKYEADKEREDRFTTRITGEVIDIKPNGNLVLQAKAMTKFDNEVSVVTLTGTVRSVDVSPDNTILSTQLAGKVIDVANEGAVRDGSRRGWVPKLLDALRPF